jgi:hypothetical protein
LMAEACAPAGSHLPLCAPDEVVPHACALWQAKLTQPSRSDQDSCAFG